LWNLKIRDITKKYSIPFCARQDIKKQQRKSTRKRIQVKLVKKPKNLRKKKVNQCGFCVLVLHLALAPAFILDIFQKITF